jgi:hypothetical protein
VARASHLGRKTRTPKGAAAPTGASKRELDKGARHEHVHRTVWMSRLGGQRSGDYSSTNDLGEPISNLVTTVAQRLG